MFEFFRDLFDTSGFMPRRQCGDWSPGLIWLHSLSDVLIWMAYVSIPLVLVYFVGARRGLPYRRVFGLFAAFILACGFTHLIESMMFTVPIYRLSGLMKAVTAVVSWATVVALIPVAADLPAGLRHLEQLSARPSREPRRLFDYGVGVAAGLFAFSLRAVIDPFLHDDHAFMVPLLGVIFAAWHGGFGPAVVALGLNLVLFNIWFLEPRGQLTAGDLGDQFLLILFTLCGLSCSLLGELQLVARRQSHRDLFDLETEVALRRRTEHELRASEARFRQLADAMPQIVWITRPDGYHEYYNEKWYEYIGCTPAECLGHGWNAALHPDDRQRAIDRWNHSLTTGEVYEIEYRFRRRDGVYRWFLGRALPVRDEVGTIVRWFGTCTDIDDQKNQAARLEEMVRERTAELQQSAAELARSNRELEQFASVASHDLQEPLRKIQTFGDRLKQKAGGQLGEAGTDYLDRVLNAAGRMRRLIEDLLAFSRVSTKPTSPGPVDLSAIVRDVLGDLEERLQSCGGRVEVGELLRVEADPSQMRQLFQNLIGNALKFAKPDVPPVVAVTAERDGGTVRLRVADNGIGFESKYAERIFQVFQRLHGRDEYEGTGVGLAIVRKIAERHGGGVTAEGRPGGGATFTVILPAEPGGGA